MNQFQVRTDLALETREKFEEDNVEIKGVRVEEEYRENGIYVKAFVPAELYKNLEMNLEKKPSSCQASPLAGPMDILAMEAGGVQRKE